jgi:hypothetical protein
MATHPKTPRQSPEALQLVQLREHHTRELRRIDDALALLGEVRRLAAKADKKMGRVRALADAAPPIEAPAKRRYTKRRTTATKAAKAAAVSSATRSRAKAKTGTRPTDLVRRAFLEAGDRTMTRADLFDVTGFREMGWTSGGGANGASRVLGLALSRLVKSKEIRRTRGGAYVAHKIAPLPVGASANGSGGAHA